MRADKTVTVTLEMTEREATALAAMSTVVHDYLYSQPKNKDHLVADIEVACRVRLYDLGSVLVDLLPVFRRVDINPDALRNRLEGFRPILNTPTPERSDD
jgi:hypothetical protein